MDTDFFATGRTQAEPAPSRVGSYQLNDDMYNYYRNNLLENVNGTIRTTLDNFTSDQMQDVAIRPNSRSTSVNYGGKFDWMISPEMKLSAFLNGRYSNSKSAPLSDQLLNHELK